MIRELDMQEATDILGGGCREMVTDAFEFGVALTGTVGAVGGAAASSSVIGPFGIAAATTLFSYGASQTFTFGISLIQNTSNCLNPPRPSNGSAGNCDLVGGLGVLLPPCKPGQLP